ncbi:hypothetical protein [Ralstonia insidiosa]|jgi:hypothetical protein|nr:hypothetical protein [Ralstonia insidiosa]MBA9939902.1 hypothetical protein [Ralstonia insidiosa]MBC9968564.1 hypothetical protein [Ralstonia insidiosa]MBX3904615.1 hypothetical protein [Ralstonia insidiosa]
MKNKSTWLSAGIVLGAGLLVIAAVTGPGPSIVVFALPRDAAAYASYKARESMLSAVSVAGLVIFIACLVARVAPMLRKDRSSNTDTGYTK